MPIQYALHIAAGCGDEAEVVRLLTQKPALASERDDLMRTPLHYAAARQNNLRPCTPAPIDFYLRIVDHLINAGANLNLQDRRGRTPLHCAGRAGWNPGRDAVPILVRLVEAGADLNLADENNDSAIHIGASNARLLRLILERGGIRVDKCNSDGTTALHMAATNGNAECVRLLLQYKASPFIRDFDGKRPLDYIAQTISPICIVEVANILREAMTQRRA